jgi:hypothetical protein
LARLNGIPARLAIGYGMGQLNPERGEYVITEMDAHSWPELYFPGQGWIPFEPTAGELLPERTESAPQAVPPDWAARMPDELASQMGALRTSAMENAAKQRRWLATRRIVGVLSGLLACLYTAALLRLASGRGRSPLQPGPAGELGAAYDRLLRWGGRLGRSGAPGDTPREYVTALGSTVDGIVGRARLFRKGAGRAAGTLERDASALAATYEAATYGPEPESQSGAAVVKPRSQARLWAALRWLWLVRLTARPR